MIFEIVKDQFSHLVYPNVCIKYQNCKKIWLNWSSKLQENNERKNILFAQMCAFRFIIKGFRPEVF